MRSVYLIFCFSFFLISCRNEPVHQEYKEVVVQPAQTKQLPLSQSKLPPGHPPIGDASMKEMASQLPEGHPPIDGMTSQAELPDGHPPIGDMAMNDPKMQAMISASKVDAPIVWELPEGWTEIKGSGMRLATLKSADGSVEISVTSFGGQAGGVEGNVVRWLGQLGLDPDEASTRDFLENSETVVTVGQLNARVFRFTALDMDADASMIAAITDIPGATVFLKMTGSARDLEKHFADFHNFCQSLALK